MLDQRVLIRLIRIAVVNNNNPWRTFDVHIVGYYPGLSTIANNPRDISYLTLITTLFQSWRPLPLYPLLTISLSTRFRQEFTTYLCALVTNCLRFSSIEVFDVRQSKLVPPPSLPRATSPPGHPKDTTSLRRYNGRLIWHREMTL